MAGALSRQGLFYVAGIQAAVIVVLFGALLWAWQARLRDIKKLLTEALRSQAQNTDALTRFARALEAKWPKARRPPEGEE